MLMDGDKDLPVNWQDFYQSFQARVCAFYYSYQHRPSSRYQIPIRWPSIIHKVGPILCYIGLVVDLFAQCRTYCISD